MRIDEPLKHALSEFVKNTCFVYIKSCLQHEKEPFLNIYLKKMLMRCFHLIKNFFGDQLHFAGSMWDTKKILTQANTHAIILYQSRLMFQFFPTHSIDHMLRIFLITINDLLETSRL